MAYRTKLPHIMDENGEPVFLPYRFEICSICDGHGRSSAYLGAYTQSEMDEAGPDFHDDYMAGRYDRTCDACAGDGKVAVADRRRMTAAQVRELDEAEDFEAECAAEREAERRMGC